MLDLIFRTLAAIVALRSGRHLIVLPSTQDTALLAEDLAGEGHFLVVANTFDGSLAPAELYAQLDSVTEVVPFYVIAFTDQFTDATHAPLLVRHQGIVEFRPSLEAILATRYGFNVHVWTGDGIEQATDVTGRKAVMPVLKLQSAYLRACTGLGDAWAMRYHQRLRGPEARYEYAQCRNRTYQSRLLNARERSPEVAPKIDLVLGQLVANYEDNRRNFKEADFDD